MSFKEQLVALVRQTSQVDPCTQKQASYKTSIFTMKYRGIVEPLTEVKGNTGSWTRLTDIHKEKSLLDFWSLFRYEKAGSFLQAL